jgi:hypothetical protein
MERRHSYPGWGKKKQREDHDEPAFALRLDAASAARENAFDLWVAFFVWPSLSHYQCTESGVFRRANDVAAIGDAWRVPFGWCDI